MPVNRRAFVGAALCLCTLAAAPVAKPAYPATRTENTTDTYYAKTVADPYQWLENGRDPEVVAWASAQTQFATRYLVGQANFAAIAARVAELSRTSTTRFALAIRKNAYFYLRETPPRAHAELVMRTDAAGAERVLFDPAKEGTGGAEPAIDRFMPSSDGARVEIETDVARAQDETIRIVDTATGKQLESLAHVGGGPSPVAFAWDGDGKGYVHTRRPQRTDGSYDTFGMTIYHHVIGSDAASDGYVFGREQSPKAEYRLFESVNGREQAIQESDGDGPASSIYLRSAGGTFERVADPSAGIGNSAHAAGAFVGDAFYAIACGRDPRGQIVALEPHGAFERAKIVVEASGVVPQTVVPVEGGFASLDVDGGDASARLFDRSGTFEHRLPVPGVSTIREFAADPAQGAIVVGFANYTTRTAWLAYDARANTVRDIGVADDGPGNFADVETERVLVPSLDGSVKIPLEITHAKNVVRDGSAPTIMTAYGAYGAVSSPYFDSTLLAWYERGGVFAQAMVRGGGAYGEAWHAAARLATKTVSSDDLAACAAWLAKNGYGDARHLGIEGSGAGGLLMGLALSRNPELYRAVVGHVGIYDLLRAERTPSGAYGTGEFGTVTDPAQFAFMLKQSPYHNLRRTTAYPSVLLTTGENDARADPSMSRKMVAALQATTSTDPVLLIQNPGEGQGLDDSFEQRVDRAATALTFFDSQLR